MRIVLLWRECVVSLVCAVECDTPPDLRFGRSVRVVLALPVREHVVRGWSRYFRFLVVSVIILVLSHRVVVLNVWARASWCWFSVHVVGLLLCSCGENQYRSVFDVAVLPVFE